MGFWGFGVLGFSEFWGFLAVIQVQEVDRKVQEVKVCIFPPPPPKQLTPNSLLAITRHHDLGFE